jgi:hypothetical protein
MPREAKPRDVVWDALEEILGFTPRTDSERKAFGKIVRSLKNAGATPEEMQNAAKEYTKAWPHCELTLWSFEKWFGHFLSKVVKRESKKVAACPECGIGGGLHLEDCTRARA